MAEGVSVLIPTMFDSRYVIELCLASIRKYTEHPDYRIIVCDAGVDEETHEYLSSLTHIQLIKATDWERPKDDLVRAVDTDYYVIMHDDIRILKAGWLRRRLDLMHKNENNAIVGGLGKNYGAKKRFFPLGLMVKTAVSRELGLVWGKQPEQGYDTGGLAYEKFFSQSKYKFVKYRPNKDIFHFAEMTWPKYKNRETHPKYDQLIDQRDKKMEIIKDMLRTGSY